MILINLVLTLLMLGTPQAANITVAGATNLPMPGKGIAAPLRLKNRHDTILRARVESLSDRTTSRVMSAVSFGRPLSPEQT